MQATVVITTRNRKEDLAKSVASALNQTAEPRVLIIDDGSTDGTADMIKTRFPTVDLHRSEVSRGLIFQRSHAARLATTPLLFSIDDDAVFSTPKTVEATLGEFDHSRVGAVAIPFVNVHQGPTVNQKAPEPAGVYATYSFIGTAHALRRDLFLELSGYRDLLFHQGEEEDYSIRLLAAGYITRLGNADPIHHFESPRRSWTRMDYYGARNKVLYAWQNVPFPLVVGHLCVTSIKTSLESFRPQRFWTRLRGVLSAYALCLTGAAPRQPVPNSIYRLSRALKRRGAIPCQQIEHLLPRLS